jgi:hypothetical protein
VHLCASTFNLYHIYIHYSLNIASFCFLCCPFSVFFLSVLLYSREVFYFSLTFDFYILYQTQRTSRAHLKNKIGLFTFQENSKHSAQLSLFFIYLKFASPCIIIQFKQINQLYAKIPQVYYLMFMYGSTCFGRPYAHHQELNNCSSSIWFYRWIVLVTVLLVVVGPPSTALLPPRFNGKTRGCYCSCCSS